MAISPRGSLVYRRFYRTPKLSDRQQRRKMRTQPKRVSLGVLRTAKDIRQERMGIASAGDGV